VAADELVKDCDHTSFIPFRETAPLRFKNNGNMSVRYSLTNATQKMMMTFFLPACGDGLPLCHSTEE
jgi:hypothetical protein